MKKQLVSMVAGVLLAGASLAQASMDPRVQAMIAVHRQDQMSAAMVGYCQTYAPAQALALRSAWKDWRDRQGLDLVAVRLQRAAPSAVTPLSSAQLSRLHARMDRAGPATNLCADLQAGWRGAGTDLRNRYPIAFAPEAQPALPQVVMASP